MRLIRLASLYLHRPSLMPLRHLIVQPRILITAISTPALIGGRHHRISIFFNLDKEVYRSRMLIK